MTRKNLAIWQQKAKIENRVMTVVEYRHLVNDRRIESEDDLQKEIINTWRLHTPKDQWFRIFHPANGGKRNTLEGVKFKQMGVVAGIADLVCLLPDGKVGFIELKFKRNGTSIYQDDFALFCKNFGYPYALCRTVDRAMETLKNWGIYNPNGSRTPMFNLRKGVENGKQKGQFYSV